MKGKRYVGSGAAAVLVLVLMSGLALAQAPASTPLGTAFTYQGQLKSSDVPYTGTCDVKFGLYDALTGGTQVGILTMTNLSVDGGFLTVQLDYGTGKFAGDARWLEMSVRCPAGSGTYQLLTPRQALTAAPYALYSKAAPWSGLAGVPAGFADGTDNDTTYSAGTGLTLSGTTFSANTTYLQRRVTGTCDSGNAIRVIAADGTVTCQAVGGGAGDITAVYAGTGLTGGGASGDVTLFADAAYMQRRVSGTCTAGNAIRVVNADGTVTCESVGGGGGWSLTGNAGTTPGTNFLGTTDNKALEIKVYGARAMRIEPNATSPNLIGGYSGSWVTAGAYGATISGGGGGPDYPNRVTDTHGAVGGGAGNQAGDDAGTTTDAAGATVAGGVYNIAGGEGASIGGGYYNEANAADATVAGGYTNIAGGGYATIGGGGYNSAGGEVATVGGGGYNSAGGQNSTVGGGYSNDASGQTATIGGGSDNTANYANATVGGGEGNSTAGYASTVGGGSDNTADDSWGTVGGGDRNTTNGGSATVAGGSLNVASGSAAAVGGGASNSATGYSSTVGGGGGNAAGGGHSTVGGGASNSATGDSSTVGGGYTNVAGDGATVGGGSHNTAGGNHATIAGGYGNAANGSVATVAGGSSNTASGTNSFAAGYRAKADSNGCFVWGDNTDGDLVCSVANRWVARSVGGVYFYTNGTLTSGVYVAAGGGSWASVSDRKLKENVAEVDTQALLASLARVPVTTWSYKSQDASIRHIGPMAQDFYAAFGVGEDDTHITTVDADGVALAAIQGLYAQNQSLKAENAGQQVQIDDLEARLAALESGSQAAQPQSRVPALWLFAGGLVVAGGTLAARRRPGGGR